MFITDLFVKKPIIKSLNKIVDIEVWKLKTTEQILAIFDSSELNGWVVLDFCDGKVSVKDLIVFLLSDGDSNEIFWAVPIAIGSDG